MKKLKENVHAIQVGCQIYEGPHLDKECPLNEEVKQVEEVKYGEFGRPAPFNGSNGAKFCVENSRIDHDKIIQKLESQVKTLTVEVEMKVAKLEGCKTIFANDGTPLYTPFYYSPEEIEYFSANSGFLDDEKSESTELKTSKVIKGEFKKIKDVKVEDVSLTCYTLLEVFNNEVNRLRGMDDDLFTMKKLNVSNYHVTSKIDDSEYEADDDIGFEPFDIRGDDEVELTDEESSDDDDEIAEVFRIDTNIFDYETPLYYKDDWIYEWDENVPWVDEKPMTTAKWPTCSWMDDGYCNGGNLPGTYIIGNQLHYQDYEWYEALEDSELNDEVLRNKLSWKDNMNEELCKVHELPVCNIRRFKMIKYSFGQDEEYVAIKEDKYDDFARTSKDACRAYQEIFRMMDEGWMVTRAE
ncbi:hypothetical protein Tco_0201562 [Tanacetum coccineum]